MLRPGNVVTFVDTKADVDEVPVSTKTVGIANGVYKNIEEVISTINYACKRAESHLVFEYKKSEQSCGGKVKIGTNAQCNSNCKLTHHIHLPDNLLRITGFEMGIFENKDLFSNLDLLNPNHEQNPAFIRLGYINQKKTKVSDYGSHEPFSLRHGIPDKMFVYCDVCESYITGDVRTPLLRIVPVEIPNHDNYSYGANLVKHFSPPNYIPLRKTNFRTIEIDIRDHLGKKFHSNR